MAGVRTEEARRIFAADCLGAEEIAAAFGDDARAALSSASRSLVAEIPFDRGVLMRAADEGMMLVLRLPKTSAGLVLTVMTLAERFPGRAAPGGPAEAPWFANQPFAREDACRLAWTLVDKQPAAETKNLSYAEQDEELARRSERLGLRLRRRSAVEIVYDTLLYAGARGERLLESDWDWSSTMTTDGGAVTAGQFDDSGLRLVAYSKAVRFDSLGVCATVDGGP
jgi:hypothetical protein